MLNFSAAILLLFITPGPGVLSLAGVGAAFGFRSGLRYMMGLFVGTNVVALAVVTGVGTLVLASPVIRTLLFAVSTGYLLYLAWRIASAGSKIGFTAAARQPGFRDGIALQAVNPKAYVVNTTLFSGFLLYPDAYLLEVAVKFIVINVIWLTVHFFWLWIGASIKRLNLAPKTQRVINVAMALSMLGVVVLAALSAPSSH